MLSYKEVFMQLLASAMVTWFDKDTHHTDSVLLPPRRHKYSLLELVGKLYLAPSTAKTLEKLAYIYGYKPIEIAELLLQLLLNSIPIMEIVKEETLTPEQVVDLLVDSIKLEKNVHADFSNTKTKQQNKRVNLVSELAKYNK